MKKILILNSDSPNNRGDRAILMGIVKLIRESFSEDVEVWAISEHADRDHAWFGINFIPMPVQSLSPVKMLVLLSKVKGFDYIFWGGGEILKDYTNKLALLYWVFKISLISVINPNIYGVFQGIGPTSSTFGKRLIRFVVNRCKLFITRDEDSKTKLLNWGVRTEVVSSFDPAILLEGEELTDDVMAKLLGTYNIDENVLENFIGIGPRNWYHYTKSKWLPFKYYKLLPFVRPEISSELSEKMQKNFAELLDKVLGKSDYHLIFFPMHMHESEDDIGFCRAVIDKMEFGHRARIIDRDDVSPQDFLNVIKRSRLFIGIRLHSTILSTIAGVPSYLFYYVDKGKLYFSQIGLSSYSRSIDDLLDVSKLDELNENILSLDEDRRELTERVNGELSKMREDVIDTFSREVFRE